MSVAGTPDHYVRISLDINGFLKMVGTETDKAAEKGAERVLKDAKKFIKTHAKYEIKRKGYKPGTLASEIKKEQSQFHGGGWAVEAQGPGNYTKYYAVHVELGSVKNPQPIPYLRTPLRLNHSWIKKQFEGII